jgi:hypothetical protein
VHLFAPTTRGPDGNSTFHIEARVEPGIGTPKGVGIDGYNGSAVTKLSRQQLTAIGILCLLLLPACPRSLLCRCG